MESARANAGQACQALELGDAAGATAAAAALSADVDLLTLALGSGLALLGATPGGAGDDLGPAVVQARLENIQSNVASLNAVGGSSGADLTAEAEKAAAVERDLGQLSDTLAEFRSIDPRILVAPFRNETLSITNVDLQPMHFFVPAAIALLLQHMAVTLAGLSIVNEQRGGARSYFGPRPFRPAKFWLANTAAFCS